MKKLVVFLFFGLMTSISFGKLGIPITEAATIQKAMGAIMPVVETPIIREDIIEIIKL